MWQYYYDSDADETTYYHDGENVATVDGKCNRTFNGVPHPDTPHYDIILDETVGMGTPDRDRALFNVALGFEELNDPL